MQLDDSYSDQIQFEDDDQYTPFSLNNNDQENQKFIGQTSFKQLSLSSNVQQYFDSFKKIQPKSFMKLFNFIQQVEVNTSVCAKSIERGQTIAQCYDCATDSSCIQCMDCFKNSNHQGHKVVIKKAYGGCCDCGDVEAWKKQGFCKKHTGQTIDIQIDPKQQENFVSNMKQLFFLLFWESIQQNINNCRDFSKKLLQSLSYFNQKGVYYIKLTTIMFGSKIPQNLIVSKNVNNRTILTNLLTPKIAKNLHIDDWMELFFKMFQYYPFKKLLLSTYMKNFSVIYGDQQSQMRGSSISCQLLTSYQLVRQYSLQQGSIPIGSDIRIDAMISFERPFYMLYHDLNYITKLSGDTPQVYFKFHMRNRQGLLKLFEYRKVIKNQQDKQKDQPDIFQLARFVKYFQLEFKVMEILSKIAGILQNDKQTLQIIIRTLYEEALKQENQRKMIIFKPLTRALTMFLFTYFDLHLRKLTYPTNSQNIDRFVNILSSNNEDFGNTICKLFKICVQTYLFHAKTLAQPGLNSTLYAFLYFYKLKHRLISSLDILSVKMLSIMHKWPQVNRQPVISPQDYIWQNKQSGNIEVNKQQLQYKMQNLQFIISELNLVTASESNQLYVAYNINPQCGLYRNYIEKLLLKILNQQKDNVTLTIAQQYEESFFHKNVDLAHNYLKKFCIFNKTKKAFTLNKQFEQNDGKPIDSINYIDFRCNLTNKGDFQSPQKTLQLIKQSDGYQCFNDFWSIETIKKFVVKVIEYIKLLKTGNQDNQTLSPTLNTDKLKPLFTQLMKMIYLKKKITNKPEQLEVVFDVLRKIQNINGLIDSFYESLINPQNIQQQKQQVEGIQNQKLLTNLPQKPTLQRAKSSQDERKRKLKQKMQLKKKSIKQKYAKQLAKFEQQQKHKLEKQQIQQQVEHKLNCIICKSDNQQELIYFVGISYRNHQKLLNLGPGVTCLSVQSCYHTVDHNCYKKLQKQVLGKKKPIIKCPFCKFKSNTFLPILSSSKHVKQSIQNFEVAIQRQKNVQISILQEIIKSFYHFSLLAYIDPQRTLHRRLRIYRVMLEILKANRHVYLLNSVFEKFFNKTMTLNPKVQSQSQQIKKSQGLMQLSMMLQNSEDGLTLQDLSEGQIQHLLNVIHPNFNSNSQQDSEINQNPGIIGSFVNKLKQKFTSSNKQQQEIVQQKSKQQYTTIYKQTLLRLFKFLGLNQSQEKQQNQQKIQFGNLIEQQLSPQLQICLKKLFQEKTNHQMQHHNSIYQDLTQNNNVLKIRDLPLNFKPLGRLNKCNFCQQITPSMTLCLLCDWHGCLKNCISYSNKKQKGGAFYHSRSHGEQSLFMNMQKCSVSIISSTGGASLMGVIYKDEWGNDFNNKEPWQTFFLDQGQLNKIKLVFLHE